MRIASVALVAIAVLAAGCGEQVGTAVDGPDLEGSWHLVSGSDADGPLPLHADNPVTLVVEGEQVSGRSGCNHYGTTLVRDDDGISLKNPAGTEMGCEPDIMRLESRYLTALGSTTSASRGDGALTLTGPDVHLEFATDPPVPTADVVGTTWLLESLLSGDTVSSTVGHGARLTLHADGTMSGHTGCRGFRGRYAVNGAEMVATELDADIGPDRCTEETRAQDAHVLGVLERFRATVDENLLTISAVRGGVGLQLRAEGEPLP